MYNFDEDKTYRLYFVNFCAFDLCLTMAGSKGRGRKAKKHVRDHKNAPPQVPDAEVDQVDDVEAEHAAGDDDVGAKDAAGDDDAPARQPDDSTPTPPRSPTPPIDNEEENRDNQDEEEVNRDNQVEEEEEAEEEEEGRLD